MKNTAFVSVSNHSKHKHHCENNGLDNIAAALFRVLILTSFQT